MNYLRPIPSQARANVMTGTRRGVLAALSAAAIMAAHGAVAMTAQSLTAREAAAALAEDAIVLVDLRTPGEWAQTGVPEGAWPIDLSDPGFRGRLRDALALAGDRPVAFICATGGRSGFVHGALRKAGIERSVNVGDGMMGSGAGPGWLASGLPVQSPAEAASAMPAKLAPE
jgi:rhodanese-related sulfurtransferase